MHTLQSLECAVYYFIALCILCCHNAKVHTTSPPLFPLHITYHSVPLVTPTPCLGNGHILLYITHSLCTPSDEVTDSSAKLMVFQCAPKGICILHFPSNRKYHSCDCCIGIDLLCRLCSCIIALMHIIIAIIMNKVRYSHGCL